MNFKEYFFREFFEDPFEKKNKKLLSANTGSAQHNTVGRLMNMGNRKKGVHLIAKSQSQKKKALHPMVDHILATRPTAPLPIRSLPQAIAIMKAYEVFPNEEEKEKDLARTGVKIHFVNPQLYMLSYSGGGKANVKIKKSERWKS